MQTLTQRLANPTRFMELSAQLLPWVSGAAAVVIAYGLYLSFFVAPPDYLQGETARIMFIHVPCAWLAMAVYALVAAVGVRAAGVPPSAGGRVGQGGRAARRRLHFLALVTGSLWGRPTWGTYWVWDARLTSVLILFFLYLGLMALRSSIEDESLASKLTAILALVGIVMLPIIKFSVEFGNTLHQPASVIRAGGPTIDPALLTPLLVMAVGFTLMFVAMHLKAMRNEILRRRVKALQLAEVERAQSGQLAAAE